MSYSFLPASLTNIGLVRRRNEDSHAVSPEGGPIFHAVVCDGMGGHAGGDIASQEAVAAFTDGAGSLTPEIFTATGIDSVIRKANERVLEAQDDDGRIFGMGTTLVSFLANPLDGRAFIAHVGDSRAFLWRRSSLECLTRDHNIGEEFRATGRVLPPGLNSHRFAAQITRYLGMLDFPGAEIRPLQLLEDDILLLSSDGLTNVIAEEELERFLAAHRPPAKTLQSLVDLVLERGAPDNITIIMIRVAERSL